MSDPEAEKRLNNQYKRKIPTTIAAKEGESNEFDNDDVGGGGEKLITADGYGSRTGDMIARMSNTRPRMKAKWWSRDGELIARSRNSGQIRGDPGLEKWLNEPRQHSTYLVDYKEKQL